MASHVLVDFVKLQVFKSLKSLRTRWNVEGQTPDKDMQILYYKAQFRHRTFHVPNLMLMT